MPDEDPVTMTAVVTFMADGECCEDKYFCDACLDEFLRGLRVGETMLRGDRYLIEVLSPGDPRNAVICPRCLFGEDDLHDEFPRRANKPTE